MAPKRPLNATSRTRRSKVPKPSGDGNGDAPSTANEHDQNPAPGDREPLTPPSTNENPIATVAVDSASPETEGDTNDDMVNEHHQKLARTVDEPLTPPSTNNIPVETAASPLDSTPGSSTCQVDSSSNNQNNCENPSSQNGLPSKTSDEADKEFRSPDRIFTETVGKNPFSLLFPDPKPILEGAVAVTSAKYGNSYEFLDIATVNAVQFHHPSEAMRLLVCATHADATFIKSPVGGIVNIALADPSAFIFHPDSGYLSSAAKKNWMLCSLVGHSTYFSMDKFRQICVAPFAHGWYRMTALLAKICNHKVLYFQSFRDGILFSNSKFQTWGLPAAEKNVKGIIAPIQGLLIPREEQIPVFDGHDGVRLASYWEHPYPGDVPKGCAVMLLFSIKKGNLGEAIRVAPNLPEDVKFALYLNILGVVVLAEGAEQFSDVPSQEPPEAFSVDNVLKFGGAPDVDNDDVDDDENADTLPDDPLL